MLVNTEYFLDVAKYGYTNAPEGTYEYIEWWTEQKRRCVEGYKVGDLWIPGRYYFYLNFCPIRHKDKGKVLLPSFLDLDLDYFLTVQKAIDLKKNLCVDKARQKGFSFKNASLAAYNFHIIPESITVIGAFLDTYADDVWSKIKGYHNSLLGTAFRKRCSPDNDEFKRAAYQINETKEWKGYLSELHKLCFSKNASAGIGKTADLILFEEAGKWPSLIQSLAYTIDTITLGENQTGTIIIYGSAGEMSKGGSLALQEVFYHPEKYNCLAFDNIYEPSDTKIGYFVPVTKFYPPYVDKDGNSDEASAKEAVLKKRELKKQGTNSDAYFLEIIQNPLVPSESFFINSGTVFDTIRLNQQIMTINNSRELQSAMRYGELEWVDEKGNISNSFTGKVEFFVGKPVYSDKHEIIRNRYQIWELPDEKLKIKDNIYVGGCDPYDRDKGTSLGSMFIYKMFTGIETTGELFVAELTGRPETVDEFCEMCAKLCVYYNSKVLLEYSNTYMEAWFIRNGFTKYLKSRPMVVYADRKRAITNNKYGIIMSETTKLFCVQKMKNYISKHSDSIFFIDLLQDMLKFTMDTNHDRSMAAMLTILYEVDLTFIGKKEVTKKQFVAPVYVSENGMIVQKTISIF